MQKISSNQEVSAALFEILETRNILEGTLVPPGKELLNQLLVAGKNK